LILCLRKKPKKIKSWRIKISQPAKRFTSPSSHIHMRHFTPIAQHIKINAPHDVTAIITNFCFFVKRIEQAKGVAIKKRNEADEENRKRK
jgi:hypothetical protein